MIKKISKYIFIFLCTFFSSKNSYAVTITDNYILSQLLYCPNRETVELGNSSFCNQWVIDVEDEKAINSTDTNISNFTVRCAHRPNVNGNSSISDNLGFSSKSSTYHKDLSYYTYRCSDGSEISTNNCNVKTVKNISYDCQKSGYYCYSYSDDTCGSSGQCWCTINTTCHRDIITYNTSSTAIPHYNEYYRYWLYRCENPVIRHRAIEKSYDPNMLKN